MGLRAWFNGDKDTHEYAKEDGTSLGNILLEWGYITEEELETAVQKSQSLLGSILQEVTEGRLTNIQLEEALMEQKIRRKKASRSEERAFFAKKKSRLVDDINQSFSSMATKLEESGG